jgi:hypothetical protein
MGFWERRRFSWIQPIIDMGTRRSEGYRDDHGTRYRGTTAAQNSLAFRLKVRSGYGQYVEYQSKKPLQGVCALLLRLYTSTELLKRLYTSPESLLEICYFR